MGDNFTGNTFLSWSRFLQNRRNSNRKNIHISYKKTCVQWYRLLKDKTFITFNKNWYENRSKITHSRIENVAYNMQYIYLCFWNANWNSASSITVWQSLITLKQIWSIDSLCRWQSSVETYIISMPCIKVTQ